MIAYLHREHHITFHANKYPQEWVHNLLAIAICHGKWWVLDDIHCGAGLPFYFPFARSTIAHIRNWKKMGFGLTHIRHSFNYLCNVMLWLTRPSPPPLPSPSPSYPTPYQNTQSNCSFEKSFCHRSRLSSFFFFFFLPHSSSPLTESYCTLLKHDKILSAPGNGSQQK